MGQTWLWLFIICITIQHREITVQTKVNQVIGNTNNGVVSLEDNAQVEANMNTVFSLIREEVAIAA